MATNVGLLFCVLGIWVYGSQASIFTNPLFRIARFDPMHNECGAEPGNREPCGRRHDAIGEHECKSRGCCWDDTDRLPAGTIRCFLADRMVNNPECDVIRERKDDCGYPDITETECIGIRKCCWRPSAEVNDPYCFRPKKNNLRLMDGNNPGTRYGRVEVREVIDHEEYGEWGTVCDDNFGIEESKVICKQLGYVTGRPMKEAYYGSGTGPIHVDEAECTGNEHAFDECKHSDWGEHDCSHAEDAGVECYTEDVEIVIEEEDEWEDYEMKSQKKKKPSNMQNMMNDRGFNMPF